MAYDYNRNCDRIHDLSEKATEFSVGIAENTMLRFLHSIEKL